jgi:hypothetical protein
VPLDEKGLYFPYHSRRINLLLGCIVSAIASGGGYS